MAEAIKFYKKDKAVLLFLHFLKSFLVSFNFLKLVVLILQRELSVLSSRQRCQIFFKLGKSIKNYQKKPNPKVTGHRSDRIWYRTE